MSDGEKTPDKHRGLKEPWKPGQSGNPTGRPKGARNKLCDAFVESLHDDFIQHGKAVIEKVRAEEPAQYMRVVAGLLPKEVKLENAPLSEMSDDELSRLIDIIRAALPSSDQTGDGTGKAAGPDQAPPIQTLQ